MNSFPSLKVFPSLIISCLITSHAFAYQNVKVEGRHLLEDFDQDGTYEPFVIKGVGYSPMPVGRHVSDWGYPDAADPRPDNIFDDPAILNRDFSLLQAMNANTIRLWKGNNTQITQSDIEDPNSPWYQQWSELGRFPNYMTQQTLDLAENHGIKVIAGFWMENEGYWQCTPQGPVYTRTVDYTDPLVRNDIISRFLNFVYTFKDHPAVLLWAVGNENNYSFSNDPLQIQAYYSLVDQMAYYAHLAEGGSYHPVALVHGDVLTIGDENLGTDDASLEHLDIWGANVYRGDSFGTLFNEYKTRSEKPLWIAEFGADAWHTNNVHNPIDGFEDQTTQAEWAGQLWDEIVDNIGFNIGGTIMEYSDEWWKPYEWACGAGAPVCNSSHGYDGFGPIDVSCPADGIIDEIPAMPDQFINSEWWGIVSIAPNPAPYGADIVAPRQIYTTLQDRFAQEVNIPPVVNAYVTQYNGDSFVPVASILANSYVVFNADAYDLDGSLGYPVFQPFGNNSVISYIWNFNDGVPAGLEIFTQIPTHRYGAEGAYLPQVTVFDNDGNSSVDKIPLTVEGVNQSPVVNLNMDTGTTVFVNTPITFSADASDPDGTIGYPLFYWLGNMNKVKYIWDFGDGTKGIKRMASSPKHTYTKAGSYTVKVTAVDNLGAQTTASQVIEVIEEGTGTEITGNISGTTWDLTGSPYIIKGNVNVTSGNLVIEPGVEVKVDGNYYLSGSINAQGTPGQKIKFTSNNLNPSVGSWNQIRLTTSWSVMRHAIIEYATTGIYMYEVSPTIENSLIRHNTHGIFVDHNNANPTVRYNTITENSIGVRLRGDLNDLPRGNYNFNSIYNNTSWNVYAWTGYFRYTLNFKNNYWGTTDPYAIMATIDDRRTHSKDYATVDFVPFLDGPGGNVTGANYLAGRINSNTTLTLANSPYVVLTNINSDTGASLTIEPGVEIRFDGNFNINMRMNALGTAQQPIKFTSNKPNPQPGDWAGITMINSGNIIQHAVIEYASNGIYMYEVSPTIENSLIRHNTHGIFVDHNNANPAVRYNTITENSIGVRLRGDLNDLPRGNYNFNSIYNNTSWNVYAWTGYFRYTLNFKNNYWGTTDPYAIMATIDDRRTHSKDYATVDFVPFLDGPGGNVTGANYLAGRINSNTTLTLANSPYVVLTNINSDTGASLTIEPGVEIRFDGNYHIDMPSLTAVGTLTQFIRFTSNKPVPAKRDWDRIYIRSSGSRISYTIVEFADIGVYGDSVAPRVEYSAFHTNRIGMYFRASAAPAVFNNYIVNNDYGIYLDGYFIAPMPLGSYNYNNIFGNAVRDFHLTLNNENRWRIINARANWWGTTDTSLINQHINDSADQGPSATVDYTPILQSMAPFPLINISPALIGQPANGATISTTSVIFNWSGGSGVSNYMLEVGSTPAGNDIYSAEQGLNTSAAVNGIVLDGTPLYVRLSSEIDSVWHITDYEYQRN